MLAHCVVKNSNNRSSFPHTCLSEGCQHPSITQAQTQNYPWSSPSLTPTKQPIAENSASHLHCHPPPPAPRSTLRSSPVPGLRRGLPAHVLTPTLASLQLVPGKAAGVIFSRCKSNHVISPVPASLKASRDFLLFSG